MQSGMQGVSMRSKKPHWTKRISDQNLSAFVLGKIYDKHLLEATIADVVSVVIRRHFLPRHPDLDTSECFSLGFSKSFMKLKEPWIDPTCDLVVIVYSTARNEIGNYLRKLRKERFVAPEEFDYVVDNDKEDTEYELIDDLSVGFEDIANRLRALGIVTCTIDSFISNNIENNNHGRHERKTSFDWFTVKSAVIRTIACRN